MYVGVLPAGEKIDIEKERRKNLTGHGVRTEVQLLGTIGGTPLGPLLFEDPRRRGHRKHHSQ